MYYYKTMENNEFYLKQLTIEDSKDCYELLKHIGKSENDFTNPVSEMSFNEYKKWLKQQDEWSRGEGLPEGYVPQVCFWLMVDKTPVGFGKIRLGLTPRSRIEGGNIGYAIDSRFRGKGYGTKLLELLIAKAKELSLQEVLLTVKLDNYASCKVAERNGGVILQETDSWRYYTIKGN